MYLDGYTTRAVIPCINCKGVPHTKFGNNVLSDKWYLQLGIWLELLLHYGFIYEIIFPYP